jgi:hypothetical protein
MNLRTLALLGTMTAALMAAGCGGGGDSAAQETAPSQPPPPTQPPAPKAEDFTKWLKEGVLAKGEDDGGLPQPMDDIEFDHSGNENPAVFAEVIPPAEPVVVPPDTET